MILKAFLFGLFIVSLLGLPAFAVDEPHVTQQHDHEGHHGHTMAPIELDRDVLTPEALIQLNMRRDGSGTGWQPNNHAFQW